MALLHVHFTSQVLEMKTAMDVLLPERPCPRPNGKWPVLYLLHGLSSDHTSWQRFTSIERYAQEMDLAIVMPGVQRSFYTDMKHGMRYWTFISEELPALCERMFPLSARREDRFAAGLSMGGYGALKLGLLCPDRYAAVACLSGPADMVGMADEEEHNANPFWNDIFGTLDELTDSENDLAAAAKRLIASGKPHPAIYMACGTEDFLYENNKEYLRRFQEPLGIEFEEGPGGHTWDFWDTYIQRVLEWMPIR